MSEPHYVIKELTAYQLLNALCICSRHVQQFTHVLTEEIGDGFHHYYNLYYPSNHSNQQTRTHYLAITTDLGKIHTPGMVGRVPSEAIAADIAIIVNALMYHDRHDVVHSDNDIYEQTSINPEENAAAIKLHRSEPLSTEKLLILPSIKPELIDHVGNGLRSTKPAFRFASSVKGTYKGTFFHLRYENEFHADPLTYLATQVGQRCRLYSAHNINGNRIFVPDSQILYQEKLQCFVELANYLYPGNQQAADEQPFAALIPTKESKGVNPEHQVTSYFNLCNLRWHSPLALEPVENQHYHLQVHDFAKMQAYENLQHNPDDNKQWRKDMGFDEPSSGYKLSLVEAPKTFSPNKKQIDEQRKILRRQVDELNYKLTYLDSIQLKSPILRRFSQQQLLQLADFLRSFPITTIKESRIKYAFSETDRDPAGLHYFMYDPGNAIIEAFDAFRARDCDDKRCTRFTIDPMWDSVYRNNSQHKIYVPEGKVMYPPLHGWRSSEMDQYMRSVMGIWFSELSANSIPEQPIYLFEYDDADSDAKDSNIWVSILDEQKFTPFHERLGFFNDNLELVYEQYNQTASQGSVATFITDMASNLKRKTMAEQMVKQSDAAQALFEDAANKAAQTMATTFDQLLSIFTDKTLSMQVEITQLAEHIHQQNNQLVQLKALVESMEQFGHELKIEDTTLQTDLQQINDTVESINNKMNLYINNHLAVKRKRIVEKVENVVDELNRQHRKLNDKISSLW